MYTVNNHFDYKLIHSPNLDSATGSLGTFKIDVYDIRLTANGKLYGDQLFVAQSWGDL
jgi:hypothetical protein